MDVQVLANQQKFIYNSSVWTQEVILKTFWKWWKIELNGQRKSEKSMLAEQHDDDDDY